MPENKKAEEIEKIVKIMHAQNPRIAKALKQQYFCHSSAAIKAKKLGMSYPSFKVYVDMGKQWVAGRLSSHFDLDFIASQRES